MGDLDKMTVKRFETWHSHVTGRYVPIDNEHEYVFEGLQEEDNCDTIVELLNKFHEENRDLKTGTYINAKNTIKELQKENRRLKDRLQEYEEDDTITNLETEIAQLKEKINQLQFNKAIGQREYNKIIQENMIDEYDVIDKEEARGQSVTYRGIPCTARHCCTVLNRLTRELNEKKAFLKIIDDYYIQYGDDKTLFDLHKPSDIRSLMYILNRDHGYTEYECEYNKRQDDG